MATAMTWGKKTWLGPGESAASRAERKYVEEREEAGRVELKAACARLCGARSMAHVDALDFAWPAERGIARMIHALLDRIEALERAAPR